METVMILITLLLAVTALAKAEVLEREIHFPKKKPSRMRDPTTITDADLRKMAVLQKQQDNFVNYDGRPQMPIDEATILTERGK